MTVERKALEMWREREMQFPARVRRMKPDEFDMLEAWPRMLRDAADFLAMVRAAKAVGA